MVPMTGLAGALDRLYRVCGLIAALLLIALTGLVLLSILSRLVDTFIAGVTEYAGYTMAASAFFAMSYTYRSGGHIRVSLVISRFAGRSREGIEIWCRGGMAVITGYLAFYLARLTYFSWVYEEVSEGGDAIALWIPQLPTAIGAFIFAVCALDMFVRALLNPAAELKSEVAGGGGEP